MPQQSRSPELKNSHRPFKNLVSMSDTSSRAADQEDLSLSSSNDSSDDAVPDSPQPRPPPPARLRRRLSPEPPSSAVPSPRRARTKAALTPRVNRCRIRKGVFGMRPTFEFFAGEALLMAGRRGKSGVKIVSTSSFAELFAVLDVTNRKSLFKLAPVAPGASFSCQVTTVYEPVVYCRYFVMELQIEQENVVLHSKIPGKATNGRCTLKFERRSRLGPIKNSILVDENDKTAIIVRKINRRDLEVENLRNFPDVVCFAFAMVSWICPY
jgi:hypothetical protein